MTYCLGNIENERKSLINWIQERRPKSTVKKYKAITDEYTQYTKSKNLEPKSDVPVASFMRYAISDRPRKLGRSTVCRNIPAAISDLFQYDSTPSPTSTALVKQTKKIIERSTPTPSQDRLPITIDMIKNMIIKSGDGLEEVRNIFMIILMTFGMLRESELTQLRTEDVQLEPNPRRLSIFIRKSKTDQAADGAKVYVAETGNEICPVKWFEKFITVRNSEAVFLFHPVGKRSDIKKALSPSTPNFIVKKLLCLIQVEPSKYGSHSCRKGGCTTAVEAGVDLRVVARHGRWKSDSILDYVKDSVETKLSVSRAISAFQMPAQA
jgi:site-specific recombinase XerD